MYRMVFLLSMLGVVALSLAAIRRRSAWELAGACLFVAGVGGSLALLLAQSFFGGLRLLASLVFFVLPVFLGLGGRRVDAAIGRWSAWSAALLLVAVGVWSTQVEPRWLEIRRHRIESPKIDRPVRIVVVSDLQTDRWGEYEEGVLRAVAAERPDLVLLTGDYFQTSGDRRAQVIRRFRRSARGVFDVPLGSWAIGGDVEEGLDWEDDFTDTGVRTLSRTTRFEAGGLTLTALGARDSRPRGDSVPTILPSDRFHVAFGHAPDFALRHPPADLMLAGHVHGGQVRLPLLGPVLTLTSVPRAWAVGRTDFDGGVSRGRRTLIVSRGLGMERGQAPRIRFLCRPELVVVDLVPRRPEG